MVDFIHNSGYTCIYVIYTHMHTYIPTYIYIYKTHICKQGIVARMQVVCMVMMHHTVLCTGYIYIYDTRLAFACKKQRRLGVQLALFVEI